MSDHFKMLFQFAITCALIVLILACLKVINYKKCTKYETCANLHRFHIVTCMMFVCLICYLLKFLSTQILEILMVNKLL